MMQTKQLVGLLVAAIVIAGAIAYLENGKAGPGALTAPAIDVALPAYLAATSSVAVDSVTPVAASSTAAKQAMSAKERIAEKSAQYERAKEIVQPSGFVNTDGKPVTLSQYVGKKVVLLDIMTYSCINCIRTFPYLVDWYKKYEDKGLVIIGIHTPEFDFEKNIDNVKAAMAKYGITFPIVLDNDYGTWSAYRNQYWPRKYLIDIDGFVRYDHIGEGGYDETEAKIVELLKERADILGLGTKAKAAIDSASAADGISTAAAITAENPVAPSQSPETYFGSERNEFFGNGTPGKATGGTFEMPSQLSLNDFYLEGSWSIVADHAENTAIPARIVYPFASKKVFFVASADSPVTVDVIVDGKTLAPVTVHEARLYDIYSGDSFGRHTLELRPRSVGLRAFTLTFGN